MRKIVASDGVAGDLFGRSIALSGDTAIVGAISDDVGPNANQGSAYIYVRNVGGDNNWSEVKKLTASDGGTNDGFGSAVAIFGDTAFVGAEGDSGRRSRLSLHLSRNAGGIDNWGQSRNSRPSTELLSAPHSPSIRTRSSSAPGVSLTVRPAHRVRPTSSNEIKAGRIIGVWSRGSKPAMAELVIFSARHRASKKTLYLSGPGALAHTFSSAMKGESTIGDN